MNDALIGFSGFVGTTLLKQGRYASLFRSTNISEIRGRNFDTVVCAGAPAQKWIANKDPDSDLKKIEGLIENLGTISCRKFVLISTVDVFKSPVGVNEDTLIDEIGLHAYGKNRRLLEVFVESHFSEYLIVRLPGLVGPGLKKNIIYDFLNSNNTNLIDGRGLFQFYPMVNLWYDIHLAQEAGLKLVHLTAEPVSVKAVAREGFGFNFDNELAGTPPTYDVYTKYAPVFGGVGRYQYSARETLQAIRSYAQSENKALEIHPVLKR